MYKEVLKRAAALLLCVCMVGTSIDMGGITVYAAEEQAAENQTEEKETTDAGQEADSETVLQEEIEQFDDSLFETSLNSNIENVNVPALAADGAPIDLSAVEPSKVRVVYDVNNVYDGTQKTPLVSAVSYDGNLISPTEYMVSYGTNINAGTDAGSIVIIGNEINYTGMFTQQFDIERMNIENAAENAYAKQSETYTGSPIAKTKADIELSVGNNIIDSSNYDIKCTDKNSDTLTKDVGTKTLTITGTGNCTGTKTVEYQVVQKSFNDNTGLEFETIPSQAYKDGNPVTLDDVFITYNGTPLRKDTDYTFSCSNNTSITNQARVTITGNGNFTGTVTKYFSIVGKDISNCTVELSATDFTYNGNEQKPQTITVKDGGAVVASSNYSVTNYSDPVNAGTCTVTITGKGNYAGELTTSYEIKKYNLTDKTPEKDVFIGDISDAVYSGGAPVTPKPTVRVDGIGYLTEGTDFEYDYSKNIVASGDAEVIIVGDGKRNFTGAIKKIFTIKPRNLSDATVTVSDWTSPGSPVDPKIVKVEYDNKILTLSDDYKVTFKDINEKSELTEDAEEMNAVAIIEPANNTTNYTASKRVSFYIYGDMGKARADCNKTYTYTGKPIIPTGADLSVKSQKNQTLRENESYTISAADNVDVGTHTATLEGMGKFSYSKTVDYEIVKKPLDDPDITWTVENPVYTGEKVKPTIIATLPSGVELVEGTDFVMEEVTGQDYVNAKEGIHIKVVAKTTDGADSSNFSGEKTISFNIVPRPIGDASYNKESDIKVEGVEEVYPYTGANINPTTEPGFTIKRDEIPLTNGTDYEIQSVTDNIRAGTATITVTGKGNYNGAFKINFKIKYSLDGTYTSWKMGKLNGSQFQETTEFEYDLGKPITPVLKGTMSAMLSNGESIYDELELGTDYTVLSYSDNTEVSPGNKQASVTIKGKGNYMGTKTLEFKVIRKYIKEDATDITANEIVKGFMIYDGLPHKWEKGILLHSGKELQPDTDYEIIKCVNSGDDDPTASPSTCINAGTITLTLEGRGNYQGQRTVSYVVDKMDFSNKEKIQMTQPADIPYDGKPHKLEAKDITGTYTPSGNGTVPLTITEADYEVVSWIDEGDNDPTITDSECINAGKVTITLKAKEKNYTGPRTIEYNIVPKSLEDKDMNITPSMTSTVYNRSAQNPTVEVSSSSTDIGTLELDKDYTVSYTKKVIDNYGVATYQPIEECVDAGEYRIVVTGKNNFKGTVPIDYTIEQRDLNESVADYRFIIAQIEDQIYTGDAIIPEDLEVYEYTYDPNDRYGEFAADRKKEGMSPVRGIDYEVACQDNVNATKNQGDTPAYLTVTGIGNYKGALAANFIILPKNINDNVDGVYDVRLTEILREEYVGTAITPSLPLEYKGRILEEGADKDYTVNYEVEKEDEEGNPSLVATNVNAGYAYGTITGHGNYEGTRTFTEEDENPIFEITKRSLANNYNESNTGEIRVTVAEENGGKVIYDGLEHKPQVTVRDTLMSEEPLVLDRDCTVEYGNAVDAGEHTITIKGIGNYSESIVIKYMIHPKCFLDEDMDIRGENSIENIVDLTYTGSALTQEPIITDTEILVDGEPYILQEGKDYNFSCENNLNASRQNAKAVVTISFCGNYTGYYNEVSNNLADDYRNSTYQREFNILPRDIKDEGISLEKFASEEYNKEVHEPDAVITYRKSKDSEGYSLVKDVDYKITYNENRNQENGNHADVGTVTVTIRGIGNFTGERTTSFEILPKSLDTDKSPDIVVASIPAQIYTGKNIVPDVTVTYGNTVLEKGVDYNTVAGTNSVTPGTATVVIEGIGNYSEQRMVSFKIMGNLGTDGTIEAIPVQAYTGNQITPSPKVTFKGTELTEGVDYDVIYDNNTEVGTATFTVVGKDGYYTGTKSIVFKIAYDISKDTLERQTVIADVANAYTYTSGAIKPIPTVTYGGTELKQGTDYTLSYTKNINTGTAEITITGQNRYMGSVTKKFNIVKKNLTNCTFSTIQDFVYDGNAKTPSVVVKNGTTTLISGVDYTVKYQTNKEAGVGKMILTGSNNYSGTVIRYFNIKVAVPKSLKMTSNAATSIKLSWNAGGKVTGYEIYRLGSDGKYKKIATTSKTTYTNKKLKNAKTYKYKVRAYYKSSTGKVYSSFTGVLTTNTTPEKPKIVLSSIKAKQIKVKWSKLNLGTGYEVYQSTSKNGKYKKIATITNYKTTSYTKKSLTSKKTYYYKVRAYKTINGKKVYGKYSSIKSKKAK